MVRCLEVVVEDCFRERCEEFHVFDCAADEGLMLASEVLELVLQLLQLQVNPLNDLNLDEFFVVEVVAGADEEDEFDVGLLRRVEWLVTFRLEAVLHRDDLHVFEPEHLRDDLLGLCR